MKLLWTPFRNFCIHYGFKDFGRIYCFFVPCTILPKDLPDDFLWGLVVVLILYLMGPHDRKCVRIEVILKCFFGGQKECFQFVLETENVKAIIDLPRIHAPISGILMETVAYPLHKFLDRFVRHDPFVWRI